MARSDQTKALYHRKTKQIYLLPCRYIEMSDKRSEQSSMSLPKREGYIRLYNDNNWQTEYYPIVGPSSQSYGWYVYGKPSEYWEGVIKPSSMHEDVAAIARWWCEQEVTMEADI